MTAAADTTHGEAAASRSLSSSPAAAGRNQ
jgi:hypothetical protein